MVGAGFYSLVGFLHAISGGTVSVLVFFFFATPSPITSRPRFLQIRSSCSKWGAKELDAVGHFTTPATHHHPQWVCREDGKPALVWHRIRAGERWRGRGLPSRPLPRQSGYVRRSVTTHTIVISWTRWIGARVLVEALDSSVPVLQGLVTLSTAWWDCLMSPIPCL